MTSILSQPRYSDTASAFIASPKRLLIDGEWQSSSGEKFVPVYDPSSGIEIGAIVDASDADVERAVGAARAACDDGRWSGQSPYYREMTIRRLADLIAANATEFAELEAIDNGKSITAASQMDVPGAIAQLRYMAGWASRLDGESVEPLLAPSGAFHGYTRRAPIGVAALIVPWNIPLFFAALKLAPAQAAGCTRGRQDQFHRVDRGRQDDRALGRRQPQARDARTWGQVACDRLARHRSRTGSSGRGGRRFFQLWPDLHSGLARLRPSGRVRRAGGRDSRRSAGDSSRSFACAGYADGTAGVGAAARYRHGFHRERID